MHEQPTLADYDIVLWKIKPSDIDDRLQIGRHHEFIYMCGGETWEKPDYPDRKYWADWYESHKGIVLATLGGHHISGEDRSTTYYIGIFDPKYHSKGVGTQTTRLLLRYGFEAM